MYHIKDDEIRVRRWKAASKLDKQIRKVWSIVR